MNVTFIGGGNMARALLGGMIARGHASGTFAVVDPDPEARATVAARFVLTPFVGLLAARPQLRPDPTEVVRAFDVPISELLSDEVFREERWDVPRDLGVTPGRDRPIHFYELAGETVWGATARILTGFLEHLTADQRPAA